MITYTEASGDFGGAGREMIPENNDQKGREMRPGKLTGEGDPMVRA